MNSLWSASLPRTFFSVAPAMTLSAKIDNCYDVVTNVLPYWVLLYFLMAIQIAMIWSIGDNVENRSFKHPSSPWWSQTVVPVAFIVITWLHIFKCFEVLAYFWMMPTVGDWRRVSDTSTQAGIVAWFRCIISVFALLPEALISLATLYYRCAKVDIDLMLYGIMLLFVLNATRDILNKMCADHIRKQMDFLTELTVTAQDHQRQRMQARKSTYVTNAVITLTKWGAAIFFSVVILTLYFTSLSAKSYTPGEYDSHQDFTSMIEFSGDADPDSNDFSGDKKQQSNDFSDDLVGYNSDEIWI